MVSKIQQQQVRQLITQTLTVLCQNSLPYNAVVTIEGLLGITIDHDDVFLVNIQQSIQRPMPVHSAASAQIPVQYLRQSHHAQVNHISTPMPRHSPHELLQSPHGPLNTPHGSLPSPRGSLPSPKGVTQGIPHGIPPVLLTSQRHGTPSPCHSIESHTRKRAPPMTSRTPEPGMMGSNEPADLSMRSLARNRRNRSMSPLAKVPRVSPPGAQNDVEKRVSMILQTAQAEMKAMEFNKRRHVQHYTRHKTEVPSDGYKKHHNHLVTSEHAQMIIKVEPQADSNEISPHITQQGLNDKENYPEAWNILPELTAKWYKHNGRSPNDDVTTGQDSDVTNRSPSFDITRESSNYDVTSPSPDCDITAQPKDTRSQSENISDLDITSKDDDITDDSSDVINDCSQRDMMSTTENVGSDTEQCSATVGTIVFLKQEAAEQSESIISEKQTLEPSDGGKDKL